MLTTLLAMTIPMALALFSGRSVSAMAPMLFGGIMPPPRPVITLNTKRTPRLGAKAEAMTEAVRTSIPTNAIGRRPKESESGPPTTTDTAHAAKVAVASWPATGTDTSMSDAISTKSGGTISVAFCAARTESESTATNHASNSRPRSICVSEAAIPSIPLPAFCRQLFPTAAGRLRRSRTGRPPPANR